LVRKATEGSMGTLGQGQGQSYSGENWVIGKLKIAGVGGRLGRIANRFLPEIDGRGAPVANFRKRTKRMFLIVFQPKES